MRLRKRVRSNPRNGARADVEHQDHGADRASKAARSARSAAEVSHQGAVTGLCRGPFGIRRERSARRQSRALANRLSACSAQSLQRRRERLGADWWPHPQGAAPPSTTPVRAVDTHQPSTTSADGRSEREGLDAATPAPYRDEQPAPGDNEAAATTPQSAPAQLLRDQDQPVQLDSGHPRVLVLGPVEVTGAKGYIEAGKRGRLTEIAAFLALCPSDDHRALTAAMWPAGCTVNNRNSYMSRVRRWLGADTVPVVAEDGYRLDPRVHCDYHEAKHLIRRGLRRGGPAGDQDLAAALDLVRGVPFTPPGPGCAPRLVPNNFGVSSSVPCTPPATMRLSTPRSPPSTRTTKPTAWTSNPTPASSSSNSSTTSMPLSSPRSATVGLGVYARVRSCARWG